MNARPTRAQVARWAAIRAAKARAAAKPSSAIEKPLSARKSSAMLSACVAAAGFSEHAAR